MDTETMLIVQNRLLWVKLRQIASCNSHFEEMKKEIIEISTGSKIAYIKEEI